MIDPDSAVPPYEQVAGQLRDEIARGTLSGRVPSIHAISQHHGVSHHAASRALSILKGEGKVISVPGQGHFVRERGLVRTGAGVLGPALAAQQRRQAREDR